MSAIVRQFSQPLARMLRPFPPGKCPALWRAAAVRVRAIRAAKPLLFAAWNPVVLTLRNHQVRVRVVIVSVGVIAGVDGERVREPFVGRQLMRKGVRQCDLIVRVEVTLRRRGTRDRAHVRRDVWNRGRRLPSDSL